MTQRRRVNKEEWADWNAHPITEEFFHKVREAREELFARMASFQFDPHAEQKVIGMIAGLTKVLDTDFVEE